MRSAASIVWVSESCSQGTEESRMRVALGLNLAGQGKGVFERAGEILVQRQAEAGARGGDGADPVVGHCVTGVINLAHVVKAVKLCGFQRCHEWVVQAQLSARGQAFVAG